MIPITNILHLQQVKLAKFSSICKKGLSLRAASLPDFANQSPVGYTFLDARMCNEAHDFDAPLRGQMSEKSQLKGSELRKLSKGC